MEIARSQRGFINPFVDFLFATFGSLLVLSVVMLALARQPAKDPVTDFILAEFEDISMCPDIRLGLLLVAGGRTYWPDTTHGEVRYVPGVLAATRLLVLVHDVKLETEADFYVFLADLPANCRDERFVVSVQKAGFGAERIELTLDKHHRRCKMTPDGRLLC